MGKSRIFGSGQTLFITYTNIFWCWCKASLRSFLLLCFASLVLFSLCSHMTKAYLRFCLWEILRFLILPFPLNLCFKLAFWFKFHFKFSLCFGVFFGGVLVFVVVVLFGLWVCLWFFFCCFFFSGFTVLTG